MQYVVSRSDFTEMFFIWKNYLQPERIKPIKATSTFLFRGGVDLNHRFSEMFFVKLEVNNRVIGV